MRVEIRKGRNGKLRRMWYGNYELNGKRHCINLGVDVKCVVPESLRDFGDIVFERSRAKAQEKLEAIVREAKSSKNFQYILEKIYEQKTGSSVPEVALCDLIYSWKSIPRKVKLSEKYADSCVAIFKRFVNFVGTANPKVSHLSEVNEKMLLEFAKSEENRGVSAKTYNDSVKLLRTVWNKLLPGFTNPLLKIPTKQTDTKFRRPFSEDQLEKIIEAARGDDFIFPIIVTGICTAMRRGDCCLLRWSAIDIENDFISVKTAKTGAQVEIPIWSLLKNVLCETANSAEDFPRKRTAKDGYVFPKQAEMYLHNPDGITLRVKKILAKAGVLTATADSAQTATGGKSAKGRLRKASDYDFHSFRVTWVTIALAQGVPMEIVQRVTGHSTVSVVTKHYFQPNREDFRRVLENKLPSALRCDEAISTISPKNENSTSFAMDKLRSMDHENLEGMRDEILKFYEAKKF